jgi:hypothetical protein
VIDEEKIWEDVGSSRFTCQWNFEVRYAMKEEGLSEDRKTVYLKM